MCSSDLFYQGFGIKDAPTLERVIENLASDYTFAQYTLDEYGDEFGWDKETINTYKQLKSLNNRYEKLIGDTELLNKIYEKVTA